MKWEKADDIQKAIEKIVNHLDFSYINLQRIICFRSLGSKSRARARIWSFPKVWQLALNLPPHYIIEVISSKFDNLNNDDQKRVLIHELLHIPKNFSGSLLSHRGRGRSIDTRVVEKLFQQLKWK